MGPVSLNEYHENYEAVKCYSSPEQLKTLINIGDPVYFLVAFEKMFKEMHVEIIISIYIEEMNIDEICESLNINSYVFFQYCYDINNLCLFQAEQMEMELKLSA